MKIKEVIVEAGALSAFLKGAGMTQSAAANDEYNSAFTPDAGTTLSAQQSDAGFRPATAAQPKTLASFAQILPKDVNVIRRDPLVIRYQRRDYRINMGTKKWETVAGKPIPQGIQDLLSQWADDINDFDPPAENIKTVATLTTTDGIATLNNKGNWFINNRVQTDPVSINFLNNQARISGQIK